MSEPRKKLPFRQLPQQTSEPEANGAKALKNPERKITVLAQQISFMRQQYAKIVDRFVAGEVHSQRMDWEAANNLRAAELAQVDRILNQIEGGQ